ncbi:hypothetical protein [Pectobacterium odoriferum]|uniref:hypothetical protein n=1 Tax=Pectobacterium odoriferum TaxID=78398 RepID=UPI0011AF2764|nr:hypothetical protein [Pectobacterium odoriferum]
MKHDIRSHTKEAIKNLLLALKLEHPEILKSGGDISSEESENFLISISKLEASFESYQGTEFYKSLSISALGAGTPCPHCSGTGKV